MKYTKLELMQMETIEQAWDGDELKINDGDRRVWLTHRENRKYNGDYNVETFDQTSGRWEQENYTF
jgi:hypothetical protein